MSMVDRCSECQAYLGTQSQNGLPGTDTPPLCIRCTTKRHIRHLLAMLPERGWEFEELSEFEQQFLPSVREQFARNGTLSEKQIAILERIYEKG